jgi:DNA-binding SARP family transcriptional activator
MDFRVLGPLEVYRNDHRVELGTRRRERCLLGILLLEPGRRFSVERLVELLWDEEPPVHARSTVSNHISRLRDRLDPDRTGRDGVRLIARGGGYLIDLVPDRVDAHRFTALVEHAQTLAEPADRSRVLREALALWRGPLLADVGTDRLRSRLGVRLDELRLTAVETALRAELAGGRTGPAAAELADGGNDGP